MTLNSSLQGKVVIVTGAGTGLGKAAAVHLAEQGASVVLCGRRLEKIQDAAETLRHRGYEATAIQADVSVESDVKKLVELAIRQYGKIDILINNAGVFELGSVLETSLESWTNQIHINLTGPFLMTREVLPWMRKQKSGRIVNITSGLATNGAGGFAAYSASKAGLESLSRTTAEEEESYGIYVALFNPGTIRSEMHATGAEPDQVAPALLHVIENMSSETNGKLFQAGNI